MHIPSHIIPLKEDFTLDPKDYYGLNQTIVLANPNAPTGIALPRAEIEGILKANPNNVVIVDEAYVDFGGESCVPLIDRYENLLVVQTFSKSRQLAGARLGLAMGNAKLIADLNRVKFSLNPYNINRLTLKAGQAALEDTAYFDRTRAAIVDTRAWTKQRLEQRGFAVLDSRSNFLFASTNRKDGGTLYKELKKNGILVRHFDAPRIQNWLRITIGTQRKEEVLVAAIAGHDLLRLQTEVSCGRLEQVGTGGVGVKAQLFHLVLAHGGDHRRGGQIGAFVGVQFDVLLILRLLTRGVGGDSGQSGRKEFTHGSNPHFSYRMVTLRAWACRPSRSAKSAMRGATSPSASRV